MLRVWGVEISLTCLMRQTRVLQSLLNLESFKTF